MTARRRIGWGITAILLVAAVPLEAASLFEGFTVLILYSVLLGIAVGIAAWTHERIVIDFLLSAVWAVVMLLAISLLFVTVSAAFNGVDQIYGFILSWAAVAIYLGLGLVPAAIFSAMIARGATA